MPSSNGGNNTAEPSAAIQDDACISQLGRDDVLLGRGTGPNEHLGNIRFRQMLLEQKKAYKKAKTRQEKNLIAHDVVAAVKAKKGRFLKKAPNQHEVMVKSINDNLDANDEDDTAASDDPTRRLMYIVVGRDTAVSKAKQALRYQSDSREEQEGSEQDNEAIKNPTPNAAADNSSFNGGKEGARPLFKEVSGGISMPHDLARKRREDQFLLFHPNFHPSGSHMHGLANSTTAITNAADTPAHFPANSLLPPGQGQNPLSFLHLTSSVSVHHQEHPSSTRRSTIAEVGRPPSTTALQQRGVLVDRHGAVPSSYSSHLGRTTARYSSSLLDEVVKSSLATSPAVLGRAGTFPSTTCSLSPPLDDQQHHAAHNTASSDKARMNLDDAISSSRPELRYWQLHLEQIMQGQQLEDEIRILLRQSWATRWQPCFPPADSMSFSSLLAAPPPPTGSGAAYHRAVASSLMHDYESNLPCYSSSAILSSSSPIIASTNPGSSQNADLAIQPPGSLLTSNGTSTTIRDILNLESSRQGAHKHSSSPL
jgi:hypothetical protein